MLMVTRRGNRFLGVEFCASREFFLLPMIGESDRGGMEDRIM